ncbi:MAG TPA: hypothetical protein VH912_15830 [Streptosporangiaceae bacterium]|jgi:hypothetical protein
MTDQPGYVLEEAARLIQTVRRQLRSGAPQQDDVWSQATHEPVPGIATGAPECRYCPICRTIAAARNSGTDVTDHLADAGLALMAAFRETVAGYQRTRPPGQRRDDNPSDIG